VQVTLGRGFFTENPPHTRTLVITDDSGGGGGSEGSLGESSCFATGASGTTAEAQKKIQKHDGRRYGLRDMGKVGSLGGVERAVRKSPESMWLPKGRDDKRNSRLELLRGKKGKNKKGEPDRE